MPLGAWLAARVIMTSGRYCGQRDDWICGLSRLMMALRGNARILGSSQEGPGQGGLDGKVLGQRIVPGAGVSGLSAQIDLDASITEVVDPADAVTRGEVDEIPSQGFPKLRQLAQLTPD